MILKRMPEDFKVTELPKVTEDSRGAYSVYKLTKKGIDTYGALFVLRRRFHLNPGQIGVAGLKDKHALTVQYISIHGRQGPALNVQEPSFTLEFLFYAKKPIHAGYLKGNAFEITVRNIEPEYLPTLRQRIALVEKGVPNYYGEQRFGSHSGSSAFIGRALMKTAYEDAVKIYLTASTDGESAAKRHVKNFLAEHWGLWDECLTFVKQCGQERTVPERLLTHLKRSNNDFSGAVRFIPQSYVRLYLEAYQSYIWNETTKRVIQRVCRNTFVLPYRAGEFVFYEELDDATLHDLKIASFSFIEIDATTHFSTLIREALTEVIEKERISLMALNRPLFNAGNLKMRKLLLFPRDFLVSEPLDDELYPRHKKTTISFSLPKGTYATMITRLLFKQ